MSKKPLPSAIAFLSISLLFACAKPQPAVSPGIDAAGGGTGGTAGPASEKTVVVSTDPQAKEAQQRAETFDRLLQGKLSPQEAGALKESCQKAPIANLFCPSILHMEPLERRLRIRRAAPRKFEPHPIEPLPPKMEGKKLTNWRELRFGPIKRLLKGLEGSTMLQLRALAKRAMKEKRCPNGIAIAVAATMEDYFPEEANLHEVAQLYERGAACAHRTPVDRENYLTRAGLLYFMGKEYKKAAAVLQRSASVGNTYSARALYWLARCREALGEKVSARHALEQLGAKYPFSFHTLVAWVSREKDPGEVMLKTKPSIMKRSLKVPALNALIIEAEELNRYGYDLAAAVVVDWALELGIRAEPEVKLHLAELSDDRTKVVAVGDLLNRYPALASRMALELYFPKAFYPIFEKESLDLNPFLLLSVARQESVFNPKAVSPANAQGLMQIHPDTSAKLTDNKETDLLNPEENVTLGALYITQLIKQLGGKIYLVLAAYNAGVEKLAVWQKRYPQEDPTLFIDLISYKETRTYVASVLRNYYWYRRIFQHADRDALRRVIDPQVTKNVPPAPAPVQIAAPATPTPAATSTPQPAVPAANPVPSPPPPAAAPPTPPPPPGELPSIPETANKLGT